MTALLALCSHVNLLLTLVALVSSLFMLARHGGNKRWEYLFISTLILSAFPLIPGLLKWIGKHFTYRLDLYFCWSEQLLGNPAESIGRVMHLHRWFDIVLIVTYELILAAILIFVVGKYIFAPLDEAIRCTKAFCIASILGVLLFLIVPVSGPAYAIHGFPYGRTVAGMHVIYLTAPPNGFPSLHVVWALLIAHFSRRPVRTLAFVFFILTVLATLGTGEHYIIDVIAAFPFTALIVWFQSRESATQPDADGIARESRILARQ